MVEIILDGVKQGGSQGPQGPKGDTGATGPAGEGVPTEGTTGQVLSKASNTDYDTEWTTSSGSGDMTKAVYDPNTVESDAFDMDNMVEGNNTKIFTSTERTKLSGIETGAEVNDVDSVNGATGVVVLDTDDISEGSNLYNQTHTGDVTGATALTLATVNSDVGSFTNADITVNAKGLITAASNGSGGGGGFTPTYFQALLSSSAISTGAFQDATNWNTPTHNTGSDYSFVTSTGVVTFDTDGTYMISFVMNGNTAANNRVQVDVKIVEDVGAGFVDITGAEDNQYAMRNNTQNDGSAQINNFIRTFNATDQIKFQYRDIGVAYTPAADKTRITIMKVG